MQFTYICVQCGEGFPRARHWDKTSLKPRFCSQKCRGKWRREERKRNPVQPPPEKMCKSCGETKPASEFYAHLTRADGLNPRCKTCCGLQSALYHNEHRGEILAKQQARLDDSVELREASRIRQVAYYHKNQEAILAKRENPDDAVRERRRAYARRHYRERVAWFTELKGQHHCSRCGESHPACLEFHHRNPSEKLFNISDAATHHGWTREEVLAEMQKCDVLCANCHKIMHWEEKNGATVLRQLPLISSTT